MRNIKRAFWGLLVLTTVLWLAVAPPMAQLKGFFPYRGVMVQYTGIIVMVAMSVAMFLALRPRWLERHLSGLDKMYRLHKWLGITAISVSIVHWLWSKAPKWAVGWGLIERHIKGEFIRQNLMDTPFRGLRGNAESLGEWAFYATLVLGVIALVKYFPYRFFYKTHRLYAVAYLMLVYHAIVLTDFSYWTSALGVMLAALLVAGSYAAVVVVLRRVGAGHQSWGRIARLQYYPSVHSLEVEIDMEKGWPGHQPGQFAFVLSDRSEGAHPYTIASGWNEQEQRIVFIAKELGDHTNRLRERLRVGHDIQIEGPYGCFDFDHFRTDSGISRQIWIGAGIGITPFIAAMKHLAQERQHNPATTAPQITLFHTTSESDETAIRKLKADAQAANVDLHILVDTRDGLLTGDRIRGAIPDWRSGSIWFCGPPAFGQTLRADFSAQGFNVVNRFHQELFAMR